MAAQFSTKSRSLNFYTLTLMCILLPILASAQHMGDVVRCSGHEACYSTTPPMMVYLAQVAGSARFGSYGCMCIDGMCKIEVGINSVQMAPECISCGSDYQCRSMAVYEMLKGEYRGNERTLSPELSNENLVTDGPRHTNGYVPYTRKTNPPTDRYLPFIRSTQPPTNPPVDTTTYNLLTTKETIEVTTGEPIFTEEPFSTTAEVMTGGPIVTEDPNPTDAPEVTDGPVATTEGFGQSSTGAPVTDEIVDGTTTEDFGFNTDFA